MASIRMICRVFFQTSYFYWWFTGNNSMSSFKPHFLCFTKLSNKSPPWYLLNLIQEPLLNSTICWLTIWYHSGWVHFRLSPVISGPPMFPSFLGIRTDPNPDNRDFYPAHQIFRKLSRKMILKVAFWLVVPDSGTPESTSDILLIGPSENRFFQNERFPTLKK